MAKKQCNVCFSPVDEKEDFCPNCGGAMGNSKVIRTIRGRSTPLSNRQASTYRTQNQTSSTSSPLYSNRRISAYHTPNRAASKSSVFSTVSFWLGFILGLIGLLITIFIFDDKENTRNAAIGTLVSFVAEIVLAVIIATIIVL